MNSHREQPAPLLAGLVLAAGAGRRFGSAKQLAVFAGLPLVAQAVRALAPVCPGQLLVVTGAYQEEVTVSLSGQAVRCVYNPSWREGIAASIRQGITAIGSEPAGVLIALADQPGLQTADYERLAEAWRSDPLRPAAAWYGGHPGAPAIFPRSHWSDLLRLHGDQGARSMLEDPAALTAVDMPAAAWDVDAPSDLEGPRP